MKRISVNGRQFAYEVIGKGSPTVVFETGIGAESVEFAALADTIARSNAVFRYDRAVEAKATQHKGAAMP